MSGAIPSKQLPTFQRFETGVSKYERYASALIALIILVGLAVLMLFLIWLTSLDWSTNKEPTFTDELMGNNSNPEGIAEDFEEPGVEELADVQEPQLMDAVEAITSDPSTQKAAYEAVNGNKEQMGTGKGLGDYRESGPGSGGNLKYIPDADRWEIRYTTSNRAEYAKQLDYFKIELGAMSAATDHIAYASNLSAAQPTAATGDRASERNKKRIYFRYPQKSTTKLKGWDRELLKAAGINMENRLQVQFYPNETRQKLFALEAAELGNKSLESVLKTTFGVRATQTGFEYYVIGIKYR